VTSMMQQAEEDRNAQYLAKYAKLLESDLTCQFLTVVSHCSIIKGRAGANLSLRRP
jgi:hypothetical protein